MAMQLAEAPPHQRHRPEQSFLYQLVERHYPAVLAALAQDGVDEVLPDVPIRQWVLSVPFPLRFLFANDPAAMGAALGVVYRCIARLLRRKAGMTKTLAHCGIVTLIQRFGSALNLNVHFHMQVPDGMYVESDSGPQFHVVAAPTAQELQRLVTEISERLGRQPERQGLLVRDVQSGYLALESEDGNAMRLDWLNICPPTGTGVKLMGDDLVEYGDFINSAFTATIGTSCASKLLLKLRLFL